MTSPAISGQVHPLKQTAGTQKLMVCRCFSFSKGVFSGSMFVFRSGTKSCGNKGVVSQFGASFCDAVDAKCKFELR